MPDEIKIGSNSIKNSAIITALIAADSVNAAKLDQSDDYDFSSGSVTVATPSSDGHAASKAYVDGKISGLSWKDEPAKVATTADLAATYNNGSSGVGATLTADSSGAISVDGVALSQNDRILVKNQSTQTENGIFFVSTVGDGSTAFVLTRSTDADTPAKLLQAAIFVRQGSTQADSGYVMSSEVTAIGTSAITFAQFSGAGQVNSGDGLAKSGNTLSVDLATDAGLEFNSAKLRSKVDGTTIERTASGLAVVDGGISTSKLAAASVSSSKIATAAVGSSQLDSNAVTAAKLSDGAVATSAKISDGIVIASKLAADCIDQSKIADGAVQREHLNSNVVKTGGGIGLDSTNNDLELKIDDTTIFVDSDNLVKVKDGGISAAKLSSGSVVTDKVQAAAITNPKLSDASVSTAKLQADCIDQSKIADSAVQKEHLNSNVVKAGGGIGLNSTSNDLELKIDNATVFVDSDNLVKVKDAGISAAKLASNSVVTDKVQAAAITNPKLSDACISTAKVQDLAISNAKLSANSVSHAKLDFSMLTELFTGDGSATEFEAANASKSLTTGAVQVFKDGLRMVYKSSPSGGDEYKFDNSGSGSVLKITFGSAPTAGQKIIVDYPA